jgi:hypothetical protein
MRHERKLSLSLLGVCCQDWGREGTPGCRNMQQNVFSARSLLLKSKPVGRGVLRSNIRILVVSTESIAGWTRKNSYFGFTAVLVI